MLGRPATARRRGSIALRLVAILVVATLLAACGNYADFALPPPDPAGSSAPFDWQAEAEPVLARQDQTDVLNPAVIRFHDAYWNLYSEFDGAAWHTAVATSLDGAAWTRQGRVLSPDPGTWEGGYIAANGAALAVTGAGGSEEILYWYQAGDPPRIGLARSADGRSFTREPQPVLDSGPSGSFDEAGVADPYVIAADGVFYMFYLGQDRGKRQRLGVARSTDGVRWEKSRGNPILDLGGADAFDENGVGEPAVWSSGGSWWMLYTGRGRGEQRRIGLARSVDGAVWERVPDFAPLSGNQGWNSQVMCDPSVELRADGSIRVWFGGGDVPSPDENLNGQIGVGLLRGL